MANFYVAPWGSNSNNGTSPATPKLTIAAGLALLSAGDTLYLRGNQNGSAGFYNEIITGIPSGISDGSRTKIFNYPGESVWVKPSNDKGSFIVTFVANTQFVDIAGINFDASLLDVGTFLFGDNNDGLVSYVKLRDAELIGSKRGSPGTNWVIGIPGSSIAVTGLNELNNLKIHGGLSYGVNLASCNNIINALEIYDCGTAGIYVFNSGPVDNNIIRKCKIHDINLGSGCDGIAIPSRWGILVTGNSNQIYNNLIYKLNIPGSPADIESAAIYVDLSAVGTLLYYNTLATNFNCFGIRLAAYDTPYPSFTNIKNNIAYNNSRGGLSEGSATGTVSSNNLFDVDPSFVFESSGNYKLLAQSVAIQAAVGINGIIDDIDGVARPQQITPCIGCYEFVPPPPVPNPDPPTNLVATAITFAQIDLAWDNPGSNVVKIERKVGNNPYIEIATTAGGATSYSNTGLQQSTTYTYRVRVFDGALFSIYSNESSATTPIEPPPDPPPPPPAPTPARVRWKVTFNKAVRGVDKNQFDLVGTPLNSYIETVVPLFSGTFGTVFQVNVVLGPGAGILTLNLKVTGNIKDKAGNSLNTGFAGTTYTITTS